jgi:hypothetical protein
MRHKPIHKMKQTQSVHLIKVLPLIALLFMVVLSGCEKDEDPGVRPSVTSTDPAGNATGVALNNKISALFSVTMNASTSTKFSLKQGNVNIAGTSETIGTTASFMPAADLLPNTLYTATISKTAVNGSGTSMLNDYTWNFTTGGLADIIKPVVTSVSPVNNATGVTLSHNVVVTFSETMDASTFNALTFTLKQGTTVIAGAITTTATTATFTPAADLTANKTYTATITVGAKDNAGNALSANEVLVFTTAEAADTQLPTVNATDPLNNAAGVARNKVVSVIFSESMNPLTITNSTLTVMQGTTVVAGTVAYSVKTATFTPSAVLTSGLVYTATITTAARDLAGNGLAANTVWNFTTTNNASTLAIVDLGAAGNYVILAKAAINNIPGSAITGDLGLSPAASTYITGFALTDATGYATSTQVTGKVYAATMASPTPNNLTTAVENMITAYNDAAGRLSPDFLELGTGNIGGLTLSPGLYKWTTTVSLPSDIVISGGANDVWIFQVSGDLSMSSAVDITLTGGAQAKNIFWQVAGQATLGTTAHFEGVILSKTGITLQTGASFKGRALAQTAVILDRNAVTEPQ